MSQYQITGNFLLYNKIIHNIPGKWRRTIAYCNSQDTSENSCFSIQDLFEKKAKRGIKFFYNNLIRNDSVPAGQEKWSSNYQIIIYLGAKYIH